MRFNQKEKRKKTLRYEHKPIKSFLPPPPPFFAYAHAGKDCRRRRLFEVEIFFIRMSSFGTRNGNRGNSNIFNSKSLSPPSPPPLSISLRGYQKRPVAPLGLSKGATAALYILLSAHPCRKERERGRERERERERRVNPRDLDSQENHIHEILA